ncbi:MAG: glycosyltransferase family 2 protein [Actinomycetaceae bacterium]|nr:glycosyltransferase family 2 protein [Actinomycetaceae bacterium]
MAAERTGRSHVAVVIPAKDEADRIATTVRACKALPGADLIVVVDDGSQDKTQEVARHAGAATVRHTVNRGKASAMETGANVVAMHDAEGETPHLLLFIDADLGESATECAALIEQVAARTCDLAIANLPPQEGAGGHGFVTGLARTEIARATGWLPVQPLSGQRCITRAAFDSALPLAKGWGVETAMTIAVLRAGFTVLEVPCNITHRATGMDMRGHMHRLGQYRDVLFATIRMRLGGGYMRPEEYAHAAHTQTQHSPYRAK